MFWKQDVNERHLQKNDSEATIRSICISHDSKKKASFCTYGKLFMLNMMKLKVSGRSGSVFIGWWPKRHMQNKRLEITQPTGEIRDDKLYSLQLSWRPALDSRIQSIPAPCEATGTGKWQHCHSALGRWASFLWRQGLSGKSGISKSLSKEVICRISSSEMKRLRRKR